MANNSLKRAAGPKMDAKTWMQNAMKSAGISATNVIESYTPNIYSAATALGTSTKSLANTLKRSNRAEINNTIQSNRYFGIAQTAFKNALSDIRQGTFNNVDRMFQFEDSSDSSNDSGVTFSDDGADENVSVSVDTSSTTGAITSLREQVRQLTEAHLKTSKASLSAVLESNAAALEQNQKIGTATLAGLDSINKNLANMINYNNTTMNKFIEASMAFYGKMGVMMEDQTSSNKPTSASDVFNNENGGINMSAYKQYVKEQFKNTTVGQSASLLKSVLSDDMLAMAASNPLGFASDALVKALMPKVVTTTLQGAEQAFSSFVPKFLTDITDWTNDYSSGLGSQIRKFIGQTFGLKVENKTGFNKGKAIQKGPIPFDSETKHAITEVITNELSTQSAYLKAIANSMSIDTNKLSGNIQHYNYQSGKYESRSDIDKRIVDEIKQSILNEFNDGSFGKTLRTQAQYGVKSDKVSNRMNRNIDELALRITSSGTPISLSNKDLNDPTSDIRRQIAASSKNMADQRRLINAIKHMSSSQRNDIARTMIAMQNAGNSAITNIEDNPYSYGLYGTTTFDNKNIWDVISDNTTRKGRPSFTSFDHKASKTPIGDLNVQMGVGRSSIGNDAGKISRGFFNGLKTGDTATALSGVFDVIGEKIEKLWNNIDRHFITPIKEGLFGKKDKNGFSRDGLFSGVKNSVKDLSLYMLHGITGKSYVDSKGNTHKESKSSVMGNLKNIAGEVKEGILTKILGEEEVDKNGKKTGRRKKVAGLLGMMTSSLKDGVKGWKEAIFGDSKSTKKDREEAEKKVKKELKERLPDTLTGSALGAGFSIAAGNSLLGTLIGGPIGGIALGSLVGFAKKSEGFQNYLFGEKEIDKDGNYTGKRLGGLVSQKTQDYFKKNKSFLIGSTAIGTIKGTLFGGGILGNLVGGPVAGALMGLGSGIILKSEAFHEFMFGDEKTGQRGLWQAVKGIFNQSDNPDKKNKPGIGKKAVGMSIIGAGTGGLMGAFIGPFGPIGGAILGLGSSILAQKDDFHKLLFGEKDENGKRTKYGVFGKFANMMDISFFRPLATEFKNIAGDAKETLKYTFLDGIRSVFLPILEGFDGRGGIKALVGKAGSGLKKTFLDPIKNFTMNRIDSYIVTPIRHLVSGFVKSAWKSVKTVTAIPFKIAVGTMKVITKAITNVFAPINRAINKYVIKPIKNVTKTIFGAIGKTVNTLVGKPLKFAASSITYLGDKLNGVDHEDYTKEGIAAKNGGTLTRKEQRKADRKIRKQQIAKERIHNSNVRKVARALGYADPNMKEDNEALRAKAEELGIKLNTRVDPVKTKVNGKLSSTNAKSIRSAAHLRFGTLTEGGQQVTLLARIYRLLNGKFGGKDLPNNDSSSGDDDVVRNLTSNIKRGTGTVINGARNAKSIRRFGNEGVSSAEDIGESAIDEGSFNPEQVAQEMRDAGGWTKWVTSRLFRRSGKGGRGATTRQTITREAQSANKESQKESSATYKRINKALDQKAKTARKNAVTADELRKIKAKEDKESGSSKILKAVNAGNKSRLKFNKSWTSIFGKKGLITSGLLLLAPLLLKFFNGGFEGILKNVLGGIGSTFKDAISKLSWLGKNNGGRDDGKTAAQKLSDIKNRGNSVRNEDGKWDNMSGALAKGNLKAANNIYKGAANKLFSDSTKDLISTAKGVAYYTAEDKVKSGAKIANTKLKNTAAKIGAKTAESPTLKLVKEAMESFMKKVAKLVSKSTGEEVTAATIRSAETKALKGLKGSKATKLLKKGLAKINSKVASDVATVGISEVAFVTLGALNGLSGAARLFQINKRNVDKTMILISGAMGGFTGSTIGSIIDIANEILVEVRGFDFLSEVAVLIYNAIKGKKSRNNLSKARRKMETNYTKYKDKALKKQWKALKEAGKLRKGESFKVYKKEVETGKRKAKYDSFADYNDKKNKTIGSRIGATLINGTHNIASAFKKSFSSSEPSNMRLPGGYGIGGSGSNSKSRSLVTGSYTDMDRLSKSATNSAEGAFKYATTVSSNLYKSVKGSSLYPTIDKFEKSDDSNRGNTAWYDISGNYYVKNGKNYDYYNGNNDLIAGDIDSSQIQQLKATGLLIKNKKLHAKSGNNTAAHKIASTISSKAQDMWSSIKNNLSDAYGAVVRKVKNFGSTVKHIGSKVVSGVKSTGKKINNILTKAETSGPIAAYNLPTGGQGNGFNASMLFPKLSFGGAGNNAFTIDTLGDYMTESANAIVTGMLTGNYTTQPSSNGSSSSSSGGDSGIAKGHFKKLVMIGDSRTVGMAYALGAKHVSGDVYKKGNKIFVAKVGQGYSWFINSGIKQADKYITSDSCVVIWLGINDCSTTQAKRYASLVNNKAKSWKAKHVYYMSPTPTAGNTSHNKTVNKMCQQFNRVLKNSLNGVSYIDIYSYVSKGLSSGSMKTANDGLHYQPGTYKKIYNKMVSSIGSVGGSGNGLKETISNVVSSVRSKLGGRGSYYSQTDSRWANNAYGTDGATMKDSGCGPAAMAMVASDLTGQEVTPVDMANLAESTGMRDSTGTNAGFIDLASNVYGLRGGNGIGKVNSGGRGPAPGDLYESAAEGPTILLGRNNHSESNPFTDAGHYVVTDGVDSNGNINIRDPRGASYNRKYTADELADTTGAMWGFGQGRFSQGGFGQGGFGKKKSSGKKSSGKKSSSKKSSRDNGNVSDIEKWLRIVRSLKKAIANTDGGVYSQSMHTKVTIGQKKKKTVIVRRDCSGFVSGCLKFFGYNVDVLPAHNSVGMKRNSPGMKRAGFHYHKWTGWKDLSEGDVLVYEGKHTEVFAGNKKGRHYVYNVGSNYSAGSETPTPTGFPGGASYYWRPGKAGKGCVDAPATADFSDGGTSGSSASSSSSDSGTSAPTPLEAITGFFGEAANRAMSGLLTGKYDTDYNSYFNGSQPSSDSSSSSSDDSGYSATDSNGAKAINSVFSSKGFSKKGIAAIVGNVSAESGVKSNQVEGTSASGSKLYTKNVDSGKYKNFANDSKGYGFVQWTYPTRKKGLYNYAKKHNKSIGDAGMQANYIYKELKGYPSLVSELKKGKKSVDALTTDFMNVYERPGIPRLDVRKSAAEKYYKKISGGKGNGFTNGGYGVSPSIESGFIRGGYGTKHKTSTKKDPLGTRSATKLSKVATSAERYINSSSSKETIESMMKQVVSLLTDISTNTSATSDAFSKITSNSNTSSNYSFTELANSLSDTSTGTSDVATRSAMITAAQKNMKNPSSINSVTQLQDAFGGTGTFATNSANRKKALKLAKGF